MKKVFLLIVALAAVGCSCQKSQFATTTRTYKHGRIAYSKSYQHEKRKSSKVLSHHHGIKNVDEQAAVYSAVGVEQMAKIAGITINTGIRSENLIASATMEFAFIVDQGNTQKVNPTEYIADKGYLCPDTISKVDKKKAGEAGADSSDNRKVEKLGLAGFILSIGGLVPVVCLPLAILGVIFGSISLRKIKRNPALYKGKGFAITSIILGILGILGILLFIG